MLTIFDVRLKCVLSKIENFEYNENMIYSIYQYISIEYILYMENRISIKNTKSKDRSKPLCTSRISANTVYHL